MTITLFGYTITVRKAGAKTRKFDPIIFDPIIIDEAKKAESLAALDIDSLTQKARQMRAKFSNL